MEWIGRSEKGILSYHQMVGRCQGAAIFVANIMNEDDTFRRPFTIYTNTSVFIFLECVIQVLAEEA